MKTHTPDPIYEKALKLEKVRQARLEESCRRDERERTCVANRICPDCGQAIHSHHVKLDYFLGFIPLPFSSTTAWRTECSSCGWRKDERENGHADIT